ncbi:MAG: adenylate/guanylate cyclase domain-containing protein [Chthoniobacterales bacterium]
MKRSTLAALVVGALVSALVIVLHASGALAPLEAACRSALAGSAATTRVVSGGLQYTLVLLFAFGGAWLALTSTRRQRLYLPLGIFVFELLALSWVCLLYKTFFQPLPAILALLLAFAGANAYAVLSRRGSNVARSLFSGRLSNEQMTRISTGEVPFVSEAKSYEATAVVCDIANKHDLAEELPPAELAEITEKFIAHATESFLKAGAFIETITGEGIVAIFGYPVHDEEQAETATKHAIALLDSFEKMRDGRDEAFQKFGVHFGISSGTMIVTPLPRHDGTALLTTGEPVELARRFCIANRFYGSRVLIGPRTFELASRAIVARPIDFLSGVDVRERHEIYEPLKLATEASPEEVARRDSFWNGVVLYREKRWAEAYSQFQKARGPNEQDDAPLQLYVRRLEPLALHLVDSSTE